MGRPRAATSSLGRKFDDEDYRCEECGAEVLRAVPRGALTRRCDAVGGAQCPRPLTRAGPGLLRHVGPAVSWLSRTPNGFSPGRRLLLEQLRLSPVELLDGSRPLHPTWGLLDPLGSRAAACLRLDSRGSVCVASGGSSSAEAKAWLKTTRRATCGQAEHLKSRRSMAGTRPLVSPRTNCIKRISAPQARHCIALSPRRN